METISRLPPAHALHRFDVVDGEHFLTDLSEAAKHPSFDPQISQSACLGRARRVAGFTLVELMVVVGIAAILATVSLPGFTAQISKVRRWDAVTAILRIQQSQERWRTNNTSYADNLTLLASVESSLKSSSDNGYYTLSTAPIAGSSDAGYTVNATAVADKSQSRDGPCKTLTVTVSGGSTTYTPESCWSK